jgi:hypothetical protein
MTDRCVTSLWIAHRKPPLRILEDEHPAILKPPPTGRLRIVNARGLIGVGDHGRQVVV